jgi:hypothetical protein
MMAQSKKLWEMWKMRQRSNHSVREEHTDYKGVHGFILAECCRSATDWRMKRRLRRTKSPVAAVSMGNRRQSRVRQIAIANHKGMVRFPTVTCEEEELRGGRCPRPDESAQQTFVRHEHRDSHDQLNGVLPVNEQKEEEANEAAQSISGLRDSQIRVKQLLKKRMQKKKERRREATRKSHTAFHLLVTNE